MQRTLKRELKAFEIVKREAIIVVIAWEGFGSPGVITLFPLLPHSLWSSFLGLIQTPQEVGKKKFFFFFNFPGKGEYPPQAVGKKGEKWQLSVIFPMLVSVYELRRSTRTLLFYEVLGDLFLRCACWLVWLVGILSTKGIRLPKLNKRYLFKWCVISCL